jgi:hypothetical protein
MLTTAQQNYSVYQTGRQGLSALRLTTTAVDQYAATMAQWFGVSSGANMAQVFQIW